MANKQIGGYGFGVSNTTDKQVKKSPIQNARQKTKELLNANPNGATIPKIPAGINGQLIQYLPEVKKRFAELETTVAKGSGDAGYGQAVDDINKGEKGLIQLNNDIERAAVLQKEALDIEAEGNYAMSNTDEQAENFHNLANGTFAELLQITEASYGSPRLTYMGKVYDQIDIGGQYNRELEDLVDAALSDTRELAHGESGISTEQYENIVRPSVEKDLEKIIQGKNGKNAVKDYVYQNPELINAFISNQVDIPILIDGEQNKFWNNFMESRMYKDYYNSNKTNVDFNDGFVDLILNMHDAEFQKKDSRRPTKEIEKTQAELADELIKKYRK